jgi:hypothetical protein
MEDAGTLMPLVARWVDEDGAGGSDERLFLSSAERRRE